MSEFTSPLNNIRIASPCSANWYEMYGNERKRFCGDCKLNVYNLSGMTRREAEDLIRRTEGSICVRFYKRADGSVLTQNCPVGWAKVVRRTRMIATAVFSMIIAMLSGLFAVSLVTKRSPIGVIPFVTPTPEYQPLMGAVSYTPPPSKDDMVMGKMPPYSKLVDGKKTR